jgi:hypothetical protein
MIQHSMKRSGVSLMEVLIAIGILALGLVSVMAMFPIGAVNMIQAIKDDRTAQAATNSSATFRSLWKQWYQNSDGTTRDGEYEDIKAMYLQPWIMALDDPLAPDSYYYIHTGGTAPSSYLDIERLLPKQIGDPGFPQNHPPIYNPAQVTAPRATANFARRSSQTPGHFVMIDPVGYNIHAGLGAGVNSLNVAGIPGFVPRRTLANNETVIDEAFLPGYTYTEGWYRNALGAGALYAGSPAGTGYHYVPISQTVRRFSPNPDALLLSNARNIRYSALLDDMSFAKTGIATVPGGQYDRGARYNTAWMVQRPNSSQRSNLRVKVMVFDGRPVTDIPGQEIVYGPGTASMTPAVNEIAISGPNQVRVNINATGRPPLKKGSWVMFAGTPANWQAPALGENPYPAVEFYRVRGLQENTIAGVKYLDLDVEQPLGNVQSVPLTNWQPATYMVVFEYLSEVFDRGTVSTSSVPPW